MTRSGTRLIVARSRFAYLAHMNTSLAMKDQPAISLQQSPPDSNDNKALLQAVRESKTYREYERAFSDATGLPVALRPLESWQLAHHGKRHENPFCGLMAQKSNACASCLRVQQNLVAGVTDKPRTVTCDAGMVETAVPIRLGQKILGLLQTGQVFRQKPTQRQFDRITGKMENWGMKLDKARVGSLYFNTRVVAPKQYEAQVKLLDVFAQHLSMVSNQIAVRQEKAEPPVIARAKQYIEEKHTEELSLGQVAKTVNTCTFYFCKIFKKATGLTFTKYLSRVRIEKAKHFLLNPNLRISEIAYEVGFQSLTHFNRVFKKIVGQSPTEYRARLPSTTTA